MLEQFAKKSHQTSHDQKAVKKLLGWDFAEIQASSTISKTLGIIGFP